MGDWEYQAFRDITGGLSNAIVNTIKEKRKKDREKEERMRLAEMLRRFGASPSAVEGVASGLDASTMMGLDDDVERREREKDKARAESQARDAAGQEFEQVLDNTRGQGPMSPLESTQQRAYSDMQPAGQLNAQQEMMKTFAGYNEKDQFNRVWQKYDKNPELPMTASDILAMTNNDFVKAGKYRGKPLSAMAAEDKPSTDRVFDVQVGQRREVAKARGLQEGSPEWREYVYGLKTGDADPAEDAVKNTTLAGWYNGFMGDLADPIKHTATQKIADEHGITDFPSYKKYIKSTGIPMRDDGGLDEQAFLDDMAGAFSIARQTGENPESFYVRVMSDPAYGAPMRNPATALKLRLLIGLQQ